MTSDSASRHKPLHGRRVLVTRTREQASSLRIKLEALGAKVLEVPLIRIEPLADYAPLDQALVSLEQYDVLVVTSANTANVLGKRQRREWPERLFTVAVGPATASALREIGMRVDLVPVPAVGEAVVRELASDVRGKRVLVVRAAVAREVIPDGLRAAGAMVDVVEAYKTVPALESAEILRSHFDLNAAPIDAVTFTSSSTAEHFFSLLGRETAFLALKRVSICSIGPVTSGTLRSLGVEEIAEARQHTVEGLVETVKLALLRS